MTLHEYIALVLVSLSDGFNNVTKAADAAGVSRRKMQYLSRRGGKLNIPKSGSIRNRCLLFVKEEYEKSYNKAQVSKQLGISHRTLNKLLKDITLISKFTQPPPPVRSVDLIINIPVDYPFPTNHQRLQYLDNPHFTHYYKEMK